MDPDKVKTLLIGTNHLYMIGGSELYTYYLVKALKESGRFNVEYFTIEKGLLSEKVENDLSVPFMSKTRYDLILTNHYTTVEQLRKKGPVIQICHGIVPGLENPSVFADYHVAISEEVALILTANSYPNQVIMNGIDLQYFKPHRPVNEALSTVLSLCQSDAANETLGNICAKAGIAFNWIDKNKNPEFHIAEKINDADLVVGIGRSVYDAMACGRPCIIFDDRHYNGNRGDGYLFPDRFDDFATHNCSGRYSNRQFNPDDLKRELDLYDASDGKKLRTLAEEKLDVKKMGMRLVNASVNITLKSRFRKWWRKRKKRK